jgi:hypothetical protein
MGWMESRVWLTAKSGEGGEEKGQRKEKKI